MNQQQVCKLCLQQKQLRKSHILPEFCYQPIYDTKHRAILIDAKSGKKKFIQKGLREFLLCNDCEQLLSKIEFKFSRYWFGSLGLGVSPALPPEVQDFLMPITIKGFDFNNFKLFHLSILWRSSVSPSESFNTVYLGPYEERLRKMIIQGDAGKDHQYPMLGQVIFMPEAAYKTAFELISKPQQSRLAGHHVYNWAFGGCEWTYIISDSPSHEINHLVDAFPKVTGEMKLVPVPVSRANTVRTFVSQKST